jgi:hypothetical protein
MKKDLFITVLIIAAIFGIFKLLSGTNTSGFDSKKPIDLTFYWGNGCPHCENVKKYISDNKIDQKLNINTLEVYYNKKNQQLLIEAISKCPNVTDKNNIVVPVAVSGEKCFVGDQPIIDLIKEKTAAL